MTGVPGAQDTESESVEFHRAVLERSQDLLIVVDAEGGISYSSPAIRRILGYEPGERVAESVLDLVHPDDVAAQREVLAELVAEPGRVVTSEFRAQHQDGSWRVLQGIGKNLLDDPAIRGILVNIRDITELRPAEAGLDHTRGLLHEVVNAGPVVLWMVDADGVFQLSEGRGLEALGLEPGEAVGSNVFQMYADDEQAMAIMRRALDGEEVRTRTRSAGRVFEARIRPTWDGDTVTGAVGIALDVTEAAREADRAEFHALLLDRVGQAVIATEPDGTVFFWNRAAEEMYGWSRDEAMGGNVMELTVPDISIESAQEIMDRLRSGERWAGEYGVRRKGGEEFQAFVSNVPIFEGDQLVAVVGSSTDLTQQKELEAQLRQAQKMEAVGQLAGGIAHDFNNLLTTIGGYAALAADRTDDDQVAGDLNEILGAAERARGLADKLLAFSRRRSARMEPVNLNRTLDGMAAMLKRLVGEHIRMELDLTERPWPVLADASLLEQSIVNLVVNARDAMPEGGRLTLATDRVVLEPNRVDELDVDVEPGEYMRLVVEDTGSGIDPSVMDRIFDPFFTTKDVGQGSGLGLSMVFGAVKQAEGGVVVESEPGSGTRVVVLLPRVTHGQSSGDPGSEQTKMSADAPTILVVEDEVAVLRLASRVLRREGFRVLEARSGEEARRMIEEQDASVDLVVTDVIMPEMSGPALIQRLRESRPRIRSLFMSGYTADELESRGLEREEENFLPKPFTPADLVGAVRSVLPV